MYLLSAVVLPVLVAVVPSLETVVPSLVADAVVPVRVAVEPSLVRVAVASFCILRVPSRETEELPERVPLVTASFDAPLAVVERVFEPIPCREP